VPDALVFEVAVTADKKNLCGGQVRNSEYPCDLPRFHDGGCFSNFAADLYRRDHAPPPPPRKTLAEAFAKPLDFDGAQFELAKCLGLMPNVPWDPVGHKALFWASNLFGNRLYDILEALVRMGALHQNDERQFKWNDAFDYQTTAEIEDDE
jgi:hypothetical protein